ncbi:hypothetical protein A2V80_02885 [Candidatus Woesebacteria bacterium RBG_16_39_8b]|uniref:AMP-dependent ligase C-terminal domain-containing protein n=1 Tax=Candidatus Woesebacteria bacterium RBG_16_39_8b TaxID=1802482 RepID=A0A1F7XAZ6_9BACT|nr:MAG: hypothetical protein A2V80_02885 [Candidatus Woesebacteria bacterium RBG_16_39_8b]
MTLPNKSYLHKFREVLREVLQANEFYKRKFNTIGIFSANQISTWKEFTSLPLTTRQELIKDQQKTPPFGTNLTRHLSQYTYVIRTSGTSTGIPFYQPLTPQEFNRFADVLARGYKEMGIVKGVTICFFTSSYAYPLFYEASRRLGIRMVPVEDYKAIGLLNTLKSMRVNILHSFPTALFELIELAQDRHIDLKQVGIKKIITIGEVGGGHPPTKAFFEKAWNAKVIDHIGQLESGTLAVECSQTNTYHLLKDLFITEVFDSSSNRPTTKGQLVLTSLWRQDYPLIRYRTGDIVEIDYSPCPCGKTTPRLIGGILGRTTGQLKLRSFFMFPEDIERTIRQHPEVKEYQIICRKQSGVDTVDVYAELPLSTNLDDVNKLTEDLQETVGFQPKIYPVLPKTLPRYGARKGKRFHDYRLIHGKVPSPINLNKKMISRLFEYILTWKRRKRNMQKYFQLLRNM